MNATAAVTKVGLIGAGRMGMPMVGHLAASGFDVRVYDVDTGKRAAVESRKAAWSADSHSASSCSRRCRSMSLRLAMTFFRPFLDLGMGVPMAPIP